MFCGNIIEENYLYSDHKDTYYYSLFQTVCK